MNDSPRSSTISIYSQNVSCDIHSQKLVNIENMGEAFSFENRIPHVVKTIKKLQPDVVALNEVRYEKNVKHVKDLLIKAGYIAKEFPNNDGEMSFLNFLAIRNDSKWAKLDWKQKWVALDENHEPCLKDVHDVIEGDPHGRCAGIVYLKHKDTHHQVCVLVSHVVPFGEVKRQQQNALMSLNTENMKRVLPVPTVIVGDLNRFWDETHIFQDQLQRYNVQEAKPKQFIIPLDDGELVFDGEDVGTFSPWPTDEKVYDRLLTAPLCQSPLDVHVVTDNPKLITIERTVTCASMVRLPDDSSPPEGRNPVRHTLDRRMASDHLAIVGTYAVHG